MYAVPARAQTYGATETIIGQWFAKNPGLRQRVVLTTKAAGPSRGMDWVHGGSADLSPAQLVAACDEALRLVIQLTKLPTGGKRTAAKP